MPPIVATVVYSVLILGLFVLGRDRSFRPSKALWIPVIALLIIGSRPVSVWLSSLGISQGSQASAAPNQFLDSSPLDGAISFCLIALTLIVLIARRRRTRILLRQNIPILLFFAYCGVSVFWSDYPFVAFKRWVKGVGDLLIVFVILSEAQPGPALRKLFSRMSFILVPLSVLLAKYYPDLGRSYNYWTFIPSATGVCTSKNLLGMLCLVCGLTSLWNAIVVYRDRRAKNRTRQLLAHTIILAMTLWLFSVADSVTSLSCFVIGGGLMLVTTTSRIARQPWALQLLVVSLVALSSVALFADSAGWVIQSLGRDPTLTGRTNIWQVVLSVSGNAWVGTGYESFWTGKRLSAIWARTMEGLNEAHNGYLEVYLNLGWVGVLLLAGLIVTGYRRVIRAFRRPEDGTVLNLAFFVAALIYNWSEAGFREMSLVWLCFLLAITYAPRRSSSARESSFSGLGPERRASHEVGAVGLSIPARSGGDVSDALEQFAGRRETIVGSQELDG